MKHRALIFLLAAFLGFSSLGFAEPTPAFLPPLLPSFGSQLALAGYRQASSRPVWFLLPLPWSCSALVANKGYVVCYDYPFSFYLAGTR